jgi:hypothetical protein
MVSCIWCSRLRHLYFKALEAAVNGLLHVFLNLLLSSRSVRKQRLRHSLCKLKTAAAATGS